MIRKEDAQIQTNTNISNKVIATKNNETVVQSVQSNEKQNTLGGDISGEASTATWDVQTRIAASANVTSLKQGASSSKSPNIVSKYGHGQ